MCRKTMTCRNDEPKKKKCQPGSDILMSDAKQKLKCSLYACKLSWISCVWISIRYAVMITRNDAIVLIALMACNQRNSSIVKAIGSNDRPNARISTDFDEFSKGKWHSFATNRRKYTANDKWMELGELWIHNIMS